MTYQEESTFRIHLQEDEPTGEDTPVEPVKPTIETDDDDTEEMDNDEEVL